mgnify:CR=1 FL=1
MLRYSGAKLECLSIKTGLSAFVLKAMFLLGVYLNPHPKSLASSVLFNSFLECLEVIQIFYEIIKKAINIWP